MILLATTTAALAALFLIAFDRVLARSSADRAALLEAHDRDRAEWVRERQLLLNRIKPESAQYVASADPVVLPAPVRFDDDEGYWAATESKEDLAERMLREELKARVSEDAGGPA